MKGHRFVVLDGLRGSAALVVVLLHVAQQYAVKALPNALLAVDFFYMLSGFVVAFAYEKPLQARTMGFWNFALIRVRRLYPLVVLGTSIGIVSGISAVLFKHSITMEQLALASVLGLLLLPCYVFPQWEYAFPLNAAAWSLTFEFFVNAVYAFVAPWLTARRLAVLTACSGGVLVWLALHRNGISGGNNQDNFVYGFGRVLFPFFAGVMLYRFRVTHRLSDKLAAVVIVVLPCLLLLQVAKGPALHLSLVMIAFPAIIAVGAAAEVGPKLGRLCSLLGELSFPVYILQAPLLRVGAEVLKHLHLRPSGEVWFSIIEVISVCAVAWAAVKFFDQPLQRMFRTRLSGRAEGAPPQDRERALDLAP